MGQGSGGESLNLVQFTALNANLEVVDAWLRKGQANGLSDDDIRKLAATPIGAVTVGVNLDKL